jgi:hypothetical protein
MSGLFVCLLFNMFAAGGGEDPTLEPILVGPSSPNPNLKDPVLAISSLYPRYTRAIPASALPSSITARVKTKVKQSSCGLTAMRRTKCRCEACALPCSQSLAPGEGEIVISKKRMAKQLSAQAAEMPDQPARGGSCAGEHNEASVAQSVRAGRDTMAQTRQGGEYV